MKIGIKVICTVCNRVKKPHRKSPSVGAYCDDTCSGYKLEPKPGCLWPDESEKDYGYPVCDDACVVGTQTTTRQVLSELVKAETDEEIYDLIPPYAPTD